MGTPVDLWVRHGNQITHYDGTDLAGFQMLTTPGAEELPPGRARLFLVKPETRKPGGTITNRGARTYEMWHKRDPKKVVDLDGVPDELGVRLGRAERLDYASDKWRDRRSTVQYTHSFLEKRPLVYVDREHNPRAFCLVGGDMAITRHGIE
jgi:hypothetical protein